MKCWITHDALRVWLEGVGQGSRIGRVEWFGVWRCVGVRAGFGGVSFNPTRAEV